MLNSIHESRLRDGNDFRVKMQIPEKEFFDVYEGVSMEAAEEIIGNHLQYHGDDGMPENVRIKHNKNNHVVNIELDIKYLGNDYTKATYRWYYAGCNVN